MSCQGSDGMSTSPFVGTSVAWQIFFNSRHVGMCTDFAACQNPYGGRFEKGQQKKTVCPRCMSAVGNHSAMPRARAWLTLP